MNPGESLPQYRCHKRVSALKISHIEITDSGAVITPADDGYKPFKVNSAFMDKHRPVVGGYYVVYVDGYETFSPAESFERGYIRASECNKGLTTRDLDMQEKRLLKIIFKAGPDGRELNSLNSRTLRSARLGLSSYGLIHYDKKNNSARISESGYAFLAVMQRNGLEL
jgi:hypothetical protein